jgi:dynein heavy chain, axonemal
MRRQVYFTPKSYLSYLGAYRKLYLGKYQELDVQESNFKIGVKKINEASEAIAAMKVVLSEEEVKLKEASEKTEKMLKDLEVEQRAAEKIEAEVNSVAQKCEREAEDIARQKEEAERELAAAIPAQMRAQAAVDSLDAASVNEMKANKKPQEILKLVLDAIAIYFNLRLAPIQMIPDLEVAKGINVNFWRNSFEESGRFLLGPSFDFLKNLKTYDKDSISNETIELLEPLLLTGTDWFNETTCGKVSKAIAAICKWLFAVYEYHEKSQIVKPKKIKLAQEEANL